jgi:hypothetical protein
MRNSIILVAILLVVFCSACSTLNITEIKNLEKKEFDSLKLNPEVEPNDLRIDIIRHTDNNRVNDSTTQTESTPYHPLGFDFGNGLFYDLSGNLSLRVDYLLNYSCEHDFVIERIDNPERKKSITKYTFHNDSLMISFPPKEKTHFIYHSTKLGDSLSVMNRKRLEYAIVKIDSSVVYRGERRVWNTIFQCDHDICYLDKKREGNKFQKIGKEIHLEDFYFIVESEDGKTLEVKSHGRKHDWTLFTIIKGDKEWFIYDSKYLGMKFEYKGNDFLVYQNNRLVTKYVLVEK